MQTERPQHKKVQTRGGELPPDLAGPPKKRITTAPPVPAIRVKAPIVEIKPSPPLLSVEEIRALLCTTPEKGEEPKTLTTQQIMDTTRGLHALFGTCAGDITVQIAQGFVDTVVPALNNRFSFPRGSAREEVKDVINKCVRRLAVLLDPVGCEKLRSFLERHHMDGTIRRYLDNLPDEPARKVEPRF